MNDPPTCDCCGELIGVYEPAVFVVSGDVRATSIAAQPELAAGANERYHRACHGVRGNGPAVDRTR
jgi:hypothetical protein